MKNLIRAALLTAGVTVALGAEKETLKEQSGAGKIPPIEVKKDPRQTVPEPTTQIRANTAGQGTPAARQQGVNTTSDQKGAGKSGSHQQPDSIDKDLQNRVLVALSTGSIGTQGIIATNQLTNIKVDVKDRVVTLRGEVTSEKNREVIGKRVKGLDGVDRVVNQLKVNPAAKSRRSGLVNPDGYSPKPNQAPR